MMDDGRHGSAGDISEGERIDVPLVGDEVEVGFDILLGRMHKNKVVDHIDDPEILVADCGVKDLLGCWQRNESGEIHFGVNGDDVLSVVLNSSRGFLADGAACCQGAK
jgi:hypothetical protein